MNLLLNRECGPQSTIGELSVDGTFECFILEDPARPVKIKGKTCIPAGIYNVIITQSARFKRRLPLLENVPSFSGIRIHSGNDPGDTEGCLLPGRTRSKDFVGESRLAFNQLFEKLDQALSNGQSVTLEIRGGFDKVEV